MKRKESKRTREKEGLKEDSLKAKTMIKNRKRKYRNKGN